MSKKAKSPKRRMNERRAAHPAEWVWGSFTLPAYVADGSEPYRPEVWLCLELPQGLVVGHRVLTPDEAAVSVADFLQASMQHPMVGPARRPARVRVATAEAARSLADAFPSLEVVVAPTPELADFEREFRHREQGGESGSAVASYLEAGRISPRLIEGLFLAARHLYLTRPWNAVADGDVMRVDCPALGIEGACVSVMGAGGQSYGFGLYPSLTAFESFCTAAERAIEYGRDASSLDLGTSYLALHFEPGATLPPSLRREAAKYRWPVAHVKAYPWPQSIDPDGVARPLAPEDIQALTACTLALATFFGRHGAELASSEDYEPMSEIYSNELTGTIRVTLPYDSFDSFDTDDDEDDVFDLAGDEGALDHDELSRARGADGAD